MELKKIIKKVGYTSIITSTLLGILGCIMVVYSEMTLRIISYIFGIILLITGIIKIIEYVTQKGEYDLLNYDIVYGILGIVIGLVVITNTGALEGILGIVVGVWMIYSGLMRFSLSSKMKTFGVKAWIPMIILATIMIFFGIYVIFAPNIIITTLGAMLLGYAIIDVIEGISFIVNVNKINN